MYIFRENEIRSLVKLNLEAVEVVEKGFQQLAAGNVTMPPIMRLDFPEEKGEVDVKTAHIHGEEQFAIKISSGFFLNFQRGLPSGNGMMLLINTRTGVPEAVLLDQGYLTDVRTAAAGAIAARYLAPGKIRTAGVIGAGSQARYQIRSLRLVRDFKRVLVYAPTVERVQSFVDEIGRELNVEVVSAESAEQVVRESDVVITTTPATAPIIQAEWLHPGLHITAMGSDAEHKQELDAAILSEADLVVCDVKEQCKRLGELHHALEQGVITDESDIVELGQLACGSKQGRRDDRQITVCDLTGTGVQDTAIAVFAYQQLIAAGAGIKI